jgi:hypothetical protein
MDFVLFFFFLLSLSSSSVMFVPVLYGLSILESLRENRKLAKKEAVGLPIPTVFFFFPFLFSWETNRRLLLEKINGMYDDGVVSDQWERDTWCRSREEEHKPRAMASVRRAAGEPAAGWDPRCVLPSRPQ